jgi:hypothetical protein
MEGGRLAGYFMSSWITLQSDQLKEMHGSFTLTTSRQDKSKLTPGSG